MVFKHRVAKPGPKISPYFSNTARLADDLLQTTAEAQQPDNTISTTEEMTKNSAQSISATQLDESTTIDANGDLTIICGTKTFLVDRHVTQRSSRLLANLLNNDTMTVTGVRPQAVAIHLNEDPAAMEVLLNIMHLNFRSIPSDLRLETLARLTHLCDKYNTLQLLKPFQEGWIKRHDIATDEVYMGNARIASLAAVTWTLGLHTVFQRIALNQLQQAIVQSNQDDLKIVIRRYIFGVDRCEWVDWVQGMAPMLSQVYRESLEALLKIFLCAFDYLSGDEFQCQMPAEEPKSDPFNWNDPPRWGFRSTTDDDDQPDQVPRLCRAALLRNYLYWISELRRKVGIKIDMSTRKVETTRGLRLVDIFECHQSAQDFDAAAGHSDCHIGESMLDEACKVLNGIPARIRQLHKAWIDERDQVQARSLVAESVADVSPVTEE